MTELVREITPNVKLLFTYTPIPGYEKYIGSYLVTGSRKAIIDPGPKTAVPGLIQAVNAAGLRPEQIDYVILTHIHIDHAGGTGTVLKLMPNARVIVHPRGLKHMVDPSALTKASLDTLGELVPKYGEIEPVVEPRIAAAGDGMLLNLDGTTLELAFTPGHAAHHMCILERKTRVLFSGDSAGILHNGLLRLTTPPPFRLKETLDSLDRIIALQPEIICYGHLGGYENADARLREFRDLLLRWYETAQSQAKSGKSVTDVFEHFIRTEPELNAYFARLDTVNRKRDYAQMTNSVNGLMSAVS